MPRPRKPAAKIYTTAQNYKHPESESPLRPAVGMQAQFRKKHWIRTGC